eukprot:8718882-Alexandrium_andersonii.AAC.1
MTAARLDCEAAVARDAVLQSEIIDVLDMRLTALAGTEELHEEDWEGDYCDHARKVRRLE